MATFSERNNLVTQSIQKEGMNDALRNSIWNVLDVCIFQQKWFIDGYSYDFDKWGINSFCIHLWMNFSKEPLDTIPAGYSQKKDTLRKLFFKFRWNQVYDFIEFTLNFYQNFDETNSVGPRLNKILEKEKAAYRIINNQVTPITSENEIEMLEETFKDDQFATVNEHLKQALTLLSDKNSPDYRNSIKESISAVESMCKIITKNDKATLAEALQVLEKDRKLHTALKEGFKKLYGYANDADGIRHAMIEANELTLADAKYFLLSCTSFINYLKSKI